MLVMRSGGRVSPLAEQHTVTTPQLESRSNGNEALSGVPVEAHSSQETRTQPNGWNYLAQKDIDNTASVMDSKYNLNNPESESSKQSQANKSSASCWKIDST